MVLAAEGAPSVPRMRSRPDRTGRVTVFGDLAESPWSHGGGLRVSPSTTDGRRYAVAVAIPFLVAVACGLRFMVATEVSIAFLVGLAILPVWASHLSRFRGMVPMMMLGASAVASGIVLTVLDRTRETSTSLMLAVSVQLLAILVQTGALLWSRLCIGPNTMAVAYGLGMLVDAIATPALWKTEPWKFAFASPVLDVPGHNIARDLARHLAGHTYFLTDPVVRLKKRREAGEFQQIRKRLQREMRTMVNDQQIKRVLQIVGGLNEKDPIGLQKPLQLFQCSDGVW
mgnify:CR=1 FL=1